MTGFESRGPGLVAWARAPLHSQAGCAALQRQPRPGSYHDPGLARRRGRNLNASTRSPGPAVERFG
jgi:hypothetical protein